MPIPRSVSQGSIHAGQDLAQQLTTKRNVPHRIEDLDKSIAAAHVALRGLLERLTPLLRPDYVFPSQTGDKVATPRDVQGSLALAILEATTQIELLQRDLADLTESLEV
jgi:hypothetical protein